jgi:hypothetical protein
VRVFSSELSDGWRDFLAIPVEKLRSIDSVRDERDGINFSMRRDKDEIKIGGEGSDSVHKCIYIHNRTRTYLHLKSVCTHVYVHN